MNTKTIIKNTDYNTTRKSVVVVVLGHVDHGKTSVLDYIRKTKTAETESGGITQHINACQIKRGEDDITFIDTPGHEVFSSMRKQGVKIADIAILIIAADDGIKTQTKEAIKYIKESKIPVIVAFNKIDKPEADITKIKNQLLEEEILLEGYGGDVPCVEISAQTGQGIEDLLNMVTLLADVSGVKEEASEESSAIIMESFQNSRKGIGAVLIMQSGIISVGDILVGNNSFVKLKAIEDYNGNRIEKATPGMPFTVYGFNKIANAGDIFQLKSNADKNTFLKNLDTKISRSIQSVPKDEEIISFIIKTDTGGTMDAILKTFQAIQENHPSVHVLYASVGDITDSDLRTSIENNATVIGFRVNQNASAKIFIRNHEKVKILSFNTVYSLSEAIQKITTDNAKNAEEIILGKMKILKIFKSDSQTTITGGKVLEGVIEKGSAKIQSKNNKNEKSFKIIRLKQEQKDINKAKEGMEIGIQLSGNVKINEGDILIYTKI